MDDKIDTIYRSIEALSSTEIEEIFRICHSNNTKYTRNNNGIFVNLNWLEESVVNQLYDYISFCIYSQKETTEHEKIKTEMNNFINAERDNQSEGCNGSKSITSKLNQNIKPSKISTSMKYYLLKKKIIRQTNFTQQLTYVAMKNEEYIS